MTIAIIMGSKSDLRIMQEAVNILKEFNIEHNVEIVSAHRTPKKLYDFATSAKVKNYTIIIAGAGGAAHLPGMVASMTSLPVIGVPINASISIAGIDSLLSIVQMPKGIPVATVAIDAAANAALLAIRILAIKDDKINTQLETYQQNLTNQVMEQKIP